MTEKDFLDYLEEYSVADVKNFKVAQDNPLTFPFEEKKVIGQGLFNKVYLAVIEGKKYVIKEGVHEMQLPVMKKFKIPLPRTLISWILKEHRSRITVSHEAALEELADYAMIATYFGFFEEKSIGKNTGATPNLLEKQRLLRNELKKSILEEDDFAELILSYVKTLKNYKKLREIVNDSSLLNYNFLPTEYLILSDSSEIVKNSGKKKLETHYIIQEFITGKPLGELSEKDEEKHPEVVKKLCLFLILSLYMLEREKKLIDCRPAEMLMAVFDWFDNTENIYVNTETGDVTLIDTRWLFDKEGTLLQKGIVMTDMIQDSLKRNLIRLMEYI